VKTVKPIAMILSERKATVLQLNSPGVSTLQWGVASFAVSGNTCCWRRHDKQGRKLWKWLGHLVTSSGQQDERQSLDRSYHDGL